MIRWHMIDTKTVSYILNGRSPAARMKLAALRGSSAACISAITEAEIRYGLAKQETSESLRAAVAAFLSRIDVLAWGSAEAVVYGELRAERERAGRTPGDMDLLIAAHAISAGAVLITDDRAFSSFAALSEVANWATDIAG